jgi:NO-binding membrane sensor protein with MHYT domain
MRNILIFRQRSLLKTLSRGGDERFLRLSSSRPVGIDRFAASHAALDLAGRVTAAQHGARLLWLSGGAISMGIGMWAMHFIGMLAFQISVRYYWPTVVLSLVVPILASALALAVVSRQRMSLRRALVSGFVRGGGIASMQCRHGGHAHCRIGPV